MKKTIILTLSLSLLSMYSFSQAKVDSLLNAGQHHFKKNEFKQAAYLWEQASELANYKIVKRDYYYYALIAYANAKDSTNTFRILNTMIRNYGFNDKEALKDPSFDDISKSIAWGKLVKNIEPPYTKDPLAAKIIISDVKNFWKAYDLVAKNPKNAKEIYKKEYFDKGTIGLDFYLANKINTIDNFVLAQRLKKKYYSSIKKNTLQAEKFNSQFKKSFVKLKEIYPDALFPPIYFVIGKLNSAGTVSSDGLILGLDQACMDDQVDKTELTNWEKANISSITNLPYTVAHELIHYQQNTKDRENTLLRASINEGMADFIGEMISGKTANERLHIWAKGKEKEIFEAFKKEMYLDRAKNWIANSDQETKDKPADLGYWVGYQICKSYYQNTLDKKKAIKEMLNIDNYKQFFEQSKIEMGQ